MQSAVPLARPLWLRLDVVQGFFRFNQGYSSMSHAKSAETFARQVAAKRTPEEKLDSIARSLVAQAIPVSYTHLTLPTNREV